jgi:hypothetical protein
MHSGDNPLKLLREHTRSPSLAPTIATDAGLAAPTLKGEIPIAPADIAPTIGTGTCLAGSPQHGPCNPNSHSARG